MRQSDDADLVWVACLGRHCVALKWMLLESLAQEVQSAEGYALADLRHGSSVFGDEAWPVAVPEHAESSAPLLHVCLTATQPNLPTSSEHVQTLPSASGWLLAKMSLLAVGEMLDDA